MASLGLSAHAHALTHHGCRNSRLFFKKGRGSGRAYDAHITVFCASSSRRAALRFRKLSLIFEKSESFWRGMQRIYHTELWVKQKSRCILVSETLAYFEKKREFLNARTTRIIVSFALQIIFKPSSTFMDCTVAILAQGKDATCLSRSALKHTQKILCTIQAASYQGTRTHVTPRHTAPEQSKCSAV